MKKNRVILFIICIFAIAIFIIVKDNISVKKEKIQIDDEHFIEKVSDSIESNKTLRIGKTEVNNNDLKRSKDLVEAKIQNTESKDFLTNDPTIELIKRTVISEEAKKNGESISEQLEETYIRNAKQMYKTAETDESEEGFINSLIKLEEDTQLTNLFRFDITKKIMDGESIDCNDEKVKSAINKYNEDKNTENLSNAYNEYVLYLCGTYDIAY